MRAALLILLLLTQTALPAVEGLNKDLTLNRSKISKAYFEGDFDLVLEALETFRKVQPNPTREDKIYAYKYLSVIYAAKPETRAKAESFMYQLLKIMPSIELMDLYISDNIEAIFNSVRSRYELQQRIGLDSGQGSRQTPAGPAAADALNPAKAPDASLAPSSRPEPYAAPRSRAAISSGKGSPAWIWWTAGAVGVAAAVAGYVYLSEPSESPVAQSRDTLDLDGK